MISLSAASLSVARSGRPVGNRRSPLTAGQVAETGAWLAGAQLPGGMVPWYSGGHADPWNHVEVAMALSVAGQEEAARRALRWLAGTQLPDGSWCTFYLADGVEEPRRDPNVCAYVATGTWWHFLATGDRALLGELWPVVEAAAGFALRMQRPDGALRWSLDADGEASSRALLAGTSSVHHSLRCAMAVAAELGYERPEWELAAERIAEAVAERPGSFWSKDRFAMDWYYPVLSGVLRGEAARERLWDGWDRFVMPGLGVRCVVDHPWVTAAETAECAMAFHVAGLPGEAADLLEWTDHLRDPDGGYSTGCVHPACRRFPAGETTTYSAGAVVVADRVVFGEGGPAGVFADGGP
ncbi:MAG: prenyltransferase, partial [Acidimicrobiales bacterium]